jgi:crotonobetainyl-CoA:carnitine CoA-transferase CaiB-like acyl-CoA transferase/nicotinamidase-related amidase
MCLSGIRVVELASLYAAPLIGTTLADFGAEVIKVEHPRGDDARRWGLAKDEVPLWWKAIARNKQLLTLDLNTESARATARGLIETADVVIENFRPGRMEKWDMAYETLAATNPGLIMVRVSGFGQTGPFRDRPGFGTLAEAFSGFAYMTGLADGPPTLPPFGLADGVAGLVGTYAVLAALYWRDAQGGDRGQIVDLSLYEPLFSILGPQVLEYDALGVLQERNGNKSPRTVPRNTYVTADGHWVAISAGTQQIANRIFAAIGHPEMAQDERFDTPAARRANADLADEIVARVIEVLDLDEVLGRFDAVEAPIAPVLNTAQIVSHEQYRRRGSVVRVADDDLGSIDMPNIPVRLSRTPGVIRHTGRTAIGADSEAVLSALEEPPATPSAVSTRPWDDLLTEGDRKLLESAKSGRRIGFGQRVAIVVVDVQNYMLGPVAGSTQTCGAAAHASVGRLSVLLDEARTAGAPVVYTKGLEGSEDAQIADQVAPQPDDIVMVKKKPSAFDGTPLVGYLTDRGIDTVVVTGGSTSGGVRATAVDAASLNFRVMVAEDCVFDQFEISHRVALFDLYRQYADVVSSAEVITALRSLDRPGGQA